MSWFLIIICFNEAFVSPFYPLTDIPKEDFGLLIAVAMTLCWLSDREWCNEAMIVIVAVIIPVTLETCTQKYLMQLFSAFASQ